MIGKLIIPGFEEDRYEHFFDDVERDDSDPDDEDDEEDEAVTAYDAGKDYIDNILCGDVLSVGTKWHNLPDFSTIDKLFKERFDIRPKERMSIVAKIKKYSVQILL